MQRKTEPNRKWVIQRCISAFRDEYENWTGLCEELLTREEMKVALAQCNEHWPDCAFCGHNVVNQRPKRPRLRVVKWRRETAPAPPHLPCVMIAADEP